MADFRRYLKLRRVAQIVVVASFVGFIALAVFGWVRSDEPFANTDAFFAAVVAPALVALLGGEFLLRSKCPRCGERFAARPGEARWRNFSSHCVNCGLRLDDAGQSKA